MSEGENKRDIRSHRDLIVWQKSMDLTVAVYNATKNFPKEETYGLTSQIRRAAASIPAHIAEGQGPAAGRGISTIFSSCPRVFVRA
jgi:hypothetical protein